MKTQPGVRALEIAPAGELRYSVALLGRQYAISLEPFNAFEAWRAGPRLPRHPRARCCSRSRVTTWLLRGWDSLDNWYNNYEYQQNVMKSQKGVPVEPDA